MDEEDRYKIYLDSGSHVEIEFAAQTEEDGGQRLRLYNPNQEKVDGYLSSSQDSTDTMSYSIGEETEAGYWYIDIDDHIGGFEGDYSFSVSVEEPQPEFEFSNLIAEPSEVYEGEEVELKVDVTNVGDEAGEKTVDFYVDGENVGSDTVTVSGGETETASVSYSPDETGTYTMSSESESGSFEVQESESSEGLLGGLLALGLLGIGIIAIILLVIVVVVIVVLMKVLT